MTFKALHQQQAPLIICNVWDVPSAQLGEKLGYQALGTSSAATVSYTHLTLPTKRIV